MDINAIKKTEAQARAGFTYIPPPANPLDNKWRSHALEVLAAKPWRDWCVGLTSTMLDLLERQGMPLANQYRLLVLADGAEHMVGCVQDEQGQFWIVGDSNVTDAYPALEMKYMPLEYNRMSEASPPATWRDGLPWSVTK